MLYGQIVCREPVEKGWSADKKYKVTLSDGRILLLRISPDHRREAVETCFIRMREAEALGISMCRALEWGECPEGIYFLQSWVEGADAEAVIPTLPPLLQYRCGLAVGRDLCRLHTIPAPADIPDWETRYGAKIDRKLRMYQESPLKYGEDACILRYIRENRHLIAGRPQTYQHGDHHIGNMMVDIGGAVVLIDFEKEDFGDPWEEFNRIVWSAQAAPYFASGTVDGYFDGQVPERFWRLLALYICNNTLSSLPWAIPFGAREIEVMREQQRQVLQWYDHMRSVVPTWYSRPVSLRPVAEEDWEMFVELLTDEVVGRTYMVPDNIDAPLAEKIFLRYLERAEDPSRYVRVIWAGDTAVGVIHDVVSENGTVELGWALISRHHGKGYCTEAVRLAIRELRDLGYKTVTAGAFIENPASLRVMEKNGLKPIAFEEIIPYKGKDHLCVYRSLDLEDGADG